MPAHSPSRPVDHPVHTSVMEPRDDSRGMSMRHDEVLSIEETVVLDGRYIEALEDMEQNHAHHRVRRVAYAVLTQSGENWTRMVRLNSSMI